MIGVESVAEAVVASPAGSHVAVTLTVPEPAGFELKVQVIGRVAELSSAMTTSAPPATVQAEPPPMVVAAVTSAVMSPSAYWFGLSTVTEPWTFHPDSVTAPALAVTV